MRGGNYTTRNYTLKVWWPAVDGLDALLDKPEDEKVKVYDHERFAIRVAYQRLVQVEFKGVAAEALAYTLEDAIVTETSFVSEDSAHKWCGLGLRRQLREIMLWGHNMFSLVSAL